MVRGGDCEWRKREKAGEEQRAEDEKKRGARRV